MKHHFPLWYSRGVQKNYFVKQLLCAQSEANKGWSGAAAASRPLLYLQPRLWKIVSIYIVVCSSSRGKGKRKIQHKEGRR